MATCLLALVPGLLSPEATGLIVPLEADHWGRVAVRIHLGEAGPYRFLLDTGSTLSAVSTAVAVRHGWPHAGRADVSGLGQTSSTGLVHSPHVRIGRRAISLRWMRVADAALPDPFEAFDGVLGQDVLGQLTYLVVPDRSLLWIDPPRAALERMTGPRLPLRWVFGPLIVVDRSSGVEWGIDTGATHPVMFREGIASRTGAHVEATTVAGRRLLDGLHGASIGVGGVVYDWETAVLHGRRERAERGLLTLSMFEAIYVNSRDRFVMLMPRVSRKGRRPDVAARLGTLEDDAAAER